MRDSQQAFGSKRKSFRSNPKPLFPLHSIIIQDYIVHVQIARSRISGGAAESVSGT